jgi:hypothetical protein
VSAAETHAGAGARPAGLERLELRIERLRVTFRFTFAFHAREVRFEVGPSEEAGPGAEPGRGARYTRLFPETFSFHPQRHDPAELILQLDDLLRKPRLLAPGANRRDSQELTARVLSQAPRYLEGLLARLETEGRLEARTRWRVLQDVALLSQLLWRFLETRELDDRRSLRVARFHLRKLVYRCLAELVRLRVSPEYLDAYMRGAVDPFDPSDDPSEGGFFYSMEQGDAQTVNRYLVRMAEWAFYRWVEGVCLDEANEAFEKEDSPFEAREAEVLRAVTADGSGWVERGADWTPFLRRAGSRDCLRVLEKLEHWFLRQYDIHHSSAVIHHAALLARGEDDSTRVLSRHGTGNYLAALALLGAPFVLGGFLYDRAPAVFDVLASGFVGLVCAAAVWFMLYRFCWKRDLTFFHASVPRIGAGIIVGYLPVFLIDEVWDLAGRSAISLLSVSAVLGFATLLYLYVEVQRRLGDPGVAFARARAVFLLGVIQAFGAGVIATALVGRFMVSRNWSPAGGPLPVEELRGTLDPLWGELPRVLGFEPLYFFPSAVLMMTFLSFFIGTFLQLMWEDLPITEPL